MIKGHIQIIKPEEVRVKGKPTYVNKIFRECVAEIMDLYGQELYNAMAMQLENTVIFKVRYCKVMDILRTEKKDYKIKYNNETYSIYQCDFAKYPRQYVILKCNYKK